MKYRGDLGTLRRVLAENGFADTAGHWGYYNDDSKDHQRRRLKVVDGNAIFDASQYKQKKLEAALRQAFGDRIITMYFIARCAWFNSQNGAHCSFCIKLKNNG